ESERAERTGTIAGRKLVNERAAAKILGCSPGVIARLRKRGVLKPSYEEVHPGVWAWLNEASQVESLRPCMETWRELDANGYTRAVDGHLFAVVATSDRTEIVDFGPGTGRMHTVQHAATHYGLSVACIKQAIGEVGRDGIYFASVNVHGAGPVIFERDIRLF